MRRVHLILVALLASTALNLVAGNASSKSNAPTETGRKVVDQPAEGTTKDPIGFVTGNAYDVAVDVRVPCPDIDLVFRRSYGSWSERVGILGYGWTCSYEWRITRTTILDRGPVPLPAMIVYAAGEEGASDGVHRFLAPAKGESVTNADGYELRHSQEGHYSLVTPQRVTYSFGPSGRLDSIAAWNGTAVTIERDPQTRRPVRAVHSDGRALGFQYDGGLLSRVTTPDPKVWIDFDYSTLGSCQVLSSVVVHSHGQTSRNRYDYCGLPQPGEWSWIDPAAILLSRGRSGLLSSANGLTEAMQNIRAVPGAFVPAVNASHPLLSRKTDANGISTRFTYSRPGDGRHVKCVRSVMDEGLFDTYMLYGEKRSTAYMPFSGGVIELHVESDRFNREVFRRIGNETRTREYGQMGDLVRETLADSQTQARIDTVCSYDVRHRVTSFGMGYCSSPSRFTRFPAWDERRGIPRRIVTPGGRERRFVADGHDIRLYGPWRGVAQILCATNDRPYAVVTPDGGRTDFVRDGEGYVSRIDSDCLPFVSMTHDLLGHVDSVTLPGSSGDRTTYVTNNWRGKPLAIHHPDGTLETFAYNGSGTRAVRHVDALGREDTYRWVLGLQVHAGRIINGVTNTLFAVEHDKQLNVIAITDPLGRQAERYALDQNERIVRVTNLEGRTMRRTYAVGDFVSFETRFDGTRVDYAYDADGNLASAAYPGDTLSFAYDGDGLRTSAANASGLVSNAYDAATGWLDWTRGADGTEVSYIRRNGGAVTSLVSVAGTTAYALDGADRLTRIDAPGATFSFGHCGWNGMVSAVTNGSGLVTAYAYDVMDRVTNIAWTASDGTAIGGFAYEYDALGRITSRTHALGTNTFDRAYTYDDFDRVATDGGTAYAYDAAGNRLSKTDAGGTVSYTLGVGDRLASWTGGSYSYNTAGCVTRIARGEDTLDLTWNSQYQLVSVSTNGAFAESYTYDALGRRVSTTTLEGTIRHVYDGVQCVADIDGNGDVVASYTWGAGIDNLLAIHTGGATYYPLTDVQGTVWGYVDANNNIVARFEYDAWGNILSSISSVPALARNRYRFQCREWSAATGLTNFRARWYDPVTGRWLSKDPIGLSGGLNLYAFCEADPINSLDPSGLEKECNCQDKTTIGVLGPPRRSRSGNTYRADPLGHGRNPITGEPKDPHIHQIDRNGNTKTFNIDGSPRDGGKIPRKDMPAFFEAVKDAGRYMLKVPLIMILPPGLFLPPGTA